MRREERRVGGGLEGSVYTGECTGEPDSELSAN